MDDNIIRNYREAVHEISKAYYFINDDESDTVYNNELYNKSVKQYPYFFIAGAGISAECVKTAMQITAECKRICRENQHSIRGNMEEQYSYWIEKAFPHKETRKRYIENLLKEKSNYGFSLIISNGNIATLPEQCKSFITVNAKNGNVSKNVVNEDKHDFVLDINNGINYNECYKILSNIPIETNDNGASKIPDKVGFLEMYDVGRIEQLNSLNRWQKSNPMETSATIYMLFLFIYPIPS